MPAAKIKKIKRSRAARTAYVGVALVPLPLFFGAGAGWAQGPVAAQSVDTLSTTRSHFDLFVGQDKPGPYTLSWTQIKISRDDKVLVVVDGATLKAEQFTLDAAKGLISFATPLKKSSVARVNYSYDSRLSQRNANVSTAPVTVPLLRFGPTDLQVTAVPNGGGKAGESETPLVWSVGGKSQFLNGGLTSQLHYAGKNGTAMRFGYNLGNDRNGVEAKFLRSEEKFATQIGKNFDLAEAAQKWSVVARLRPANWFGANFTTTSGDELTGKGKDTAQTAYAVTLGGSGKNVPTLNLARVEDATSPAKGSDMLVKTDKLDFATGIGPTVSLTAKAQRVSTEVEGDSKKGTEVADTAFAFSAGLGATTSLTAKTQRVITSVEADSKKDTDIADTTIALTTASKNKSQQLQVSVVTNSKDTGAAAEDRQTVSVKLQPGRSLTIAAEKKDQEIVPLKADGTEGMPQTAVVQTASAEIQALPGAKLTGTVQENTQNDATTASTDLNAELKVGANGLLQVAGGFTNRSTDGELKDATSLNTTRARISLAPLKGITLTGSYTENPEDKGRVMDALRHEFGFNAKLGWLEVGSGYALTKLTGVSMDDGDPQYGEVTVSLGLRFSRWTRMAGNYRDGIVYGSASPLALPGSRLYGLNVVHDIGSAFNLTFGGQMSKDRANNNKPEDMKAEAKIGARF